MNRDRLGLLGLVVMLVADVLLIAWIFAVAVFVTAGQRVITGVRVLRNPSKEPVNQETQ